MHKNTYILEAKVIPRSKLNAVLELEPSNKPGIYKCKIRIKASPVDGKANEAIVDFLAEHFQLKRRQVEVISGYTNRNKRIALTDLPPKFKLINLQGSLF